MSATSTIPPSHGGVFPVFHQPSLRHLISGNHPVNESYLEVLMPKLHHSTYYTIPTIKELADKERAEPGYCAHVKDFVIGRHGCGSIKFLGETDLRGVDLEDVIAFEQGTVFASSFENPPPGLGFHGTAEITFVCRKTFSLKELFRDGHEARVIESLERKIKDQGYEFISYDPVNEECKYRIKYFNGFRYIGFKAKEKVGLGKRIKKLTRKIKKMI